MSLAHLIPITTFRDFTAEHFPPSFSVESKIVVSLSVANQFEKNQVSRAEVEVWKERESENANCY